jgi:hypothetical protein
MNNRLYSNENKYKKIFYIIWFIGILIWLKLLLSNINRIQRNVFFLY